MKIFVCILQIILVAALAGAAQAPVDDGPEIARWYRNYDGAVSLRFDDTLDSHITHAIPLLNRHGIKATFMVNPGTSRYRANRDFWERQVPAMGHRLGNHTMNHRGAATLGEAESEIGETAEIIWKAHPRESRLTVFASGGGKKWGGKNWEQADAVYYEIARKHHQIDLYDGKHQSEGVSDRSNIDELCARMERTAAEHRYHPLHFHGVGTRSFTDAVKSLVRGYDLATSDTLFSQLLECIAARGDRLWTAPMIDILKYQVESQSAVLSVIQSTRTRLTLSLTMATDPALYDHKLTLILPARPERGVKGVRQDEETIPSYNGRRGERLVDVRPVSSTIAVLWQ